VEQQVEYLSTEDVPASVGLIVDVSLSMQSFGAYARQEALTFLQSLNEESEYFLMLFADKPRVETGGYSFHGSTRPFTGLDEAYRTIAAELKNEYVIGYRSTNTAKEDRWRQIRLKVDAPRGLSDVKVRAKRGYYAAAK
jgi:hypothetical protein